MYPQSVIKMKLNSFLRQRQTNQIFIWHLGFEFGPQRIRDLAFMCPQSVIKLKLNSFFKVKTNEPIIQPYFYQKLSLYIHIPNIYLGVESEFMPKRIGDLAFVCPQSMIKMKLNYFFKVKTNEPRADRRVVRHIRVIQKKLLL